MSSPTPVASPLNAPASVTAGSGLTIPHLLPDHLFRVLGVSSSPASGSSRAVEGSGGGSALSPPAAPFSLFAKSFSLSTESSAWGEERGVVTPIAAVGADGKDDGSTALASVGSLFHGQGLCKPCVFVHTKGCKNGRSCLFCHDFHEPKRRRRGKNRRSKARAKASSTTSKEGSTDGHCSSSVGDNHDRDEVDETSGLTLPVNLQRLAHYTVEEIDALVRLYGKAGAANKVINDIPPSLPTPLPAPPVEPCSPFPSLMSFSPAACGGGTTPPFPPPYAAAVHMFPATPTLTCTEPLCPFPFAVTMREGPAAVAVARREDAAC